MVMRTTMLIDTGPDAIVKGFGPAVKKALARAVRIWHVKFRPLHFRGGAEARYGYKNRTVKYIRRKDKRNPDRRPLVFTGTAERMIKIPVKVTTGKLRATGRMLGPWYFNIAPVTRNGPNMVDELLATTKEESDFLGDFIGQSISNDLDTIKTVRTVR